MEVQAQSFWFFKTPQERSIRSENSCARNVYQQTSMSLK